MPAIGLALHTYHVLLVLAVLACSWHAVRTLGPDGVSWRRARWGLLLLAVVPWIGGHVHFLINNWDLAWNYPLRLLLPWMGLHAGGAVISLAIATPLVLRHYRLHVGKAADAFVVTLGIGVTLARLGCFFEGCCFGRVCSWPWCVSFPRNVYVYEFHLLQGYIQPGARASAPVHPLQLYFAAVGLLLIGVGHWLQPRKRYDGQVALVGLVVFSVSAAVLEPFRDDYNPRVYWGPLPQLEWSALAMTGVSLVALLIAEWRHRGRGPDLVS